MSRVEQGFYQNWKQIFTPSYRILCVAFACVFGLTVTNLTWADDESPQDPVTVEDITDSETALDVAPTDEVAGEGVADNGAVNDGATADAAVDEAEPVATAESSEEEAAELPSPGPELAAPNAELEATDLAPEEPSTSLDETLTPAETRPESTDQEDQLPSPGDELSTESLPEPSATELANDEAAAEEQRRARQKLAITQLSDVDEDFLFVGEYQGQVAGCDGLDQPMGLQVVALGDGQFRAAKYAGGLPGTGWDRSTPEQLEGTRDGVALTLNGDTSEVVVLRGISAVYCQDGSFAGSLSKVHRQSPTIGQRAPSHAFTLFDGTDTSQFKAGVMDEQQLLKEGTELLHKFRDFTLHVEYRLPYMPFARGQQRANSGIYLQSSYEVQVLDSFGLEGVENECGALYKYRRPDLNMCLPPLCWQTYDLTFYSPRFDSDGNKIQNARLTVLHNGVAVHNNVDVPTKTGAGKQETGKLWPTKLQDHGNPVRYRNIWLIDLERPSPVDHQPFANEVPISNEFVPAPVEYEHYSSTTHR